MPAATCMPGFTWMNCDCRSTSFFCRASLMSGMSSSRRAYGPSMLSSTTWPVVVAPGSAMPEKLKALPVSTP